jgi:hypothetical protein
MGVNGYWIVLKEVITDITQSVLEVFVLSKVGFDSL